MGDTSNVVAVLVEVLTSLADEFQPADQAHYSGKAFEDLYIFDDADCTDIRRCL